MEEKRSFMHKVAEYLANEGCALLWTLDFGRSSLVSEIKHKPKRIDRCLIS